MKWHTRGSGAGHRPHGRRRLSGRSFGAGATALALLATACGDGGDDEANPVVRVPNPVIADLVESVACTGDVDVVVAEENSTTGSAPGIEVVLDPSDLGSAAAAATGPLVVALVDTVPTIDLGRGDDAWVWLDPLRMIQVSQTVGAAMVASGEFDPDVIDRCLARVQVELEQLSDEMLALADELTDEQRVIDIDAPGTVYFADSFGFVLDTSPAAVEAGAIMSSDDLDGHESYDTMMLAHTEAAIAVLQQSE